ncbi:MAG: APC family permease [Acidimicrobiia bacterium]
MSTSDHDAPIGLVGATAIGIGGMVGGGIFAVLGVAARYAGGATPVAFMIAGAVAAVTGYSYTKLSVHYPSPGGTVTFIDRAFGVSDITGTVNVVLWAGYIATTALYASAFANYAGALATSGSTIDPVVVRLLIAVGIGAPMLINMATASLVSKSEGIIVGIKLTILMIVIAAGMPSVDAVSLAPSSWPSPLGIIGAGMLIFVAYEGFELISNASTEITRPRRNLPRAYGLSIAIVIVLYVAIAVVVVGTLTPAQIEQAADYALAEAASETLGQAGFTLVGVGAVLATLSAINATLYGAARLAFTVASQGELPHRLTHQVWNQPAGLYITAGTSAAIAITLPLANIASLASAIFLIVFAVVNTAAFRCGSEAAVRRPLAIIGTIGCSGALIVLIIDSIANNPTAMVALVFLLAAVLTAEHAFLKHRRIRSV